MQDTIPQFIYKRKILSIHGKRGVITRQKIRFRSSDKLKQLLEAGMVEPRGQHENSRKNLQMAHSGLPSASSMRNLQKCSDIFFMGRPLSHGLNHVTKKEGFMAAAFITLTIPDHEVTVDSKKGYEELIKKLLQWLKYNFKVRDYIWKFEWQRRGQGHWHIFVDKFCPVDQVRTYWLNALTENGLTEKWYQENDYDPSSSCKIKGMRNENELKFYLNKYLSKKYQNEEKTEGRLWGASAHIKKSRLPHLPVTDIFLERVGNAENRGDVYVKDVHVEDNGEVKIVKRGENKEASGFWVCTSIVGKKVPVISLLCPQQRGIYDQYVTAYRQGNWEMTWELEIDRRDVMNKATEYSSLFVHKTMWSYEERNTETGNGEWGKINTIPEDIKHLFTGVSPYT